MSGHVFVATPSYRVCLPKFRKIRTAKYPPIVESFKVQVYDLVIFWALFMLYFYILILRITGSCKKEGAWMCFFAVVWDLQTTSDLRSEWFLGYVNLMLFYFKCLKNLGNLRRSYRLPTFSKPPRPAAYPVAPAQIPPRTIAHHHFYPTARTPGDRFPTHELVGQPVEFYPPLYPGPKKHPTRRNTGFNEALWRETIYWNGY